MSETVRCSVLSEACNKVSVSVSRVSGTVKCLVCYRWDFLTLDSGQHRFQFWAPLGGRVVLFKTCSFDTPHDIHGGTGPGPDAREGRLLGAHEVRAECWDITAEPSRDPRARGRSRAPPAQL